MRKYTTLFLFSLLCYGLQFRASAQSMGRAGTITGVVTDPSNATVAGATVTIANRVTGLTRSATTDASGSFKFNDVPPNNYHLEVTAGGFQPEQQDVTVRTSVPITLAIGLKLGSETTSIEVHSDVADIVESVASAHTDLDSAVLSKLPLSNTGSGISDAIALATPGVVPDSNGFFHPLGDHAETGFSFDNQPVTDQQSKQFSTQMPVNAIASMEVITGAPPAEFGDKGSLVVNAMTKSALGQPKPFGSLSANYGSFGTYGENFTYGIGGPKFGNFLVANSERSGRYLDSPEFSPLHDRGNNV
ncbi:MAG: carboxypeptidase-like regulatory domain-containing protein, partial [Acidobacteriota bacterium]|nr:carboxypeptidase-like regulatory domain-containing protein [Acidobacteriota bacterium]